MQHKYSKPGVGVSKATCLTLSGEAREREDRASARLSHPGGWTGAAAGRAGAREA